MRTYILILIIMAIICCSGCSIARLENDYEQTPAISEHHNIITPGVRIIIRRTSDE